MAGAGWLLALSAAPRRAQPAPRRRCCACSSPTAPSLTSFGEWVRIDDRVVFSLPLGRRPAPDLQLVTLAAGARRLAAHRTLRRHRAVRALRRRRAPKTTSRSSPIRWRRCSPASRASPIPSGGWPWPTRRARAMADWPRQHHGYRAADVQQMLTLLDEVISGPARRRRPGHLRAGPGVDHAAALPAETLLPAPTTAQLAEELLAASTLAETPAERSHAARQRLGAVHRPRRGAAAGVVGDARAHHGPRHAHGRARGRRRLRQARHDHPGPPAAGARGPPTCAASNGCAPRR